MRSHADSGTVAEARRLMTICNACRYCEGLCATFQAMTLRRDFAAADLDYLANLCHNCTACFHDCQYSPPHEFDVNVPRVLADLRVDAYQRFAWPGFLARAFQRNGLVVSLVTALTLSLVLFLALGLLSKASLFGVHVGPGAFYEIVSHGVMAGVAGFTFGFSILALSISAVRFSRSIRVGHAGVARVTPIASAMRDAATMKHLDGGHGDGCSSRDDGASNKRRYYHQFTMWGFLLCLAATCVATVYHYGLGLMAPYPFVSVPVLLGTLGGLGLLIGPAGLIREKLKSDRRATQPAQFGMDYAFLVLLFLISLTGLLLLGLRETAAMGMLLAVHLGLVLALFVALPYSKFVHAVYRLVALVRFAGER